MPAVLYLAASATRRDDLCAASADDAVAVEPTPRGCRLTAGSAAFDVEVVTEIEHACARALDVHYDVVLVDVGGVAGASSPLCLLDGFLAGQDAERDRERRVRRDRVVAIVDGAHAAAERVLFDIGRRQIGGWVRAPGPDAAVAARFPTTLWGELVRLTRPPRSRKALCAAGGGITGVYYELGVLKCLEDTFRGFSVHDFDMFFGISAGAIVTSLVANQISLDELIREVDPSNAKGFDLELRLRDLTIRDLPRRVRAVGQQFRDWRERVQLGEERASLTGALSQLSALFGAFFRGDAKAAQLAEIFGRPGRTDDFRQLARELYIGATDQDSREHVLFGDEPFRHVPIHQAVQASAAIHPFLASTEIEGRRYTDGFVTRTTNIAAALDRGANLIVIVDPFLPYIPDQAGFNDRHSLFWVLVQDYKTVAFTRYEKVSSALLALNPGVSSIAFLPSNRMRRLLASNPISTANYDAIVTQAYASTYRRLERLAYRLAPVLADHRIELVLDRAARRTHLLDAMPTPRAGSLLV